MKKLLSILTITTLTASVPAPLLANMALERVKRNVITSNSNNDYLPIKQIKGVNDKVQSITIDSNNNIYFGIGKGGAFVLKHGATTPTKIGGISGGFVSSAVDNLNNIYFGKFNDAYVLKHRETTPTKIVGISGQINSLALDNTKYLYLGTNDGVFVIHSALTSLEWTKQQSQFTLVDSSKMKTWTRPDLLSVDGEVNIDIANPNIDKVMFDNVQQGQTNKQWKINVKPETAPPRS